MATRVEIYKAHPRIRTEDNRVNFGAKHLPCQYERYLFK